MFSAKKFALPEVMAALFAVSLQVQLTFFKSDNYEGLRVSASDFLIPIAGMIIASSLLLHRSAWPQWKKPFGWAAPILMSIVMVGALINGYLVQGSLSQWAFTNKFCGWFVLLAYLGAGAWLATNYRDRALPVFVRIFLGFFISVASIEIFNQFLMGFDFNIGLREGWEPIRGIMDNRNAFAFLLMCAASFATTCKPLKNKNLWQNLFWIIFPILVLFNGSRTLWICCLVLAPIAALFDWNKFLKIILPSIAIGFFLFFIAFSNNQKNYFSTVSLKSMENFYAYVENPDDHDAAKYAEANGNAQRIQIIKGSIDLIKQYPFQGSGLGSALYFQEKTSGKKIDIIDNTGLWLLTETGLIGFGVFLWSAFTMALTLKRDIHSFKSPNNIFSLSVFFTLIFFVIFSLLHELLYTRFLWFILGLALAIPKTHLGQPNP